jgi:hypothetical protein
MSSAAEVLAKFSSPHTCDVSVQHAQAALRCLVLALCTIGVEGYTFRFSTLSWTSCYANVGTNQVGFYDPLFPTVCTDKTSPFRVAVTVKVAFSKYDGADSAYLVGQGAKSANFIRSCYNHLRVDE